MTAEKTKVLAVVHKKTAQVGYDLTSQKCDENDLLLVGKKK